MKNPNKLLVTVVLISIVSITTLNAQERSSFDLTIEHNTNRPGADFERFEMNEPDPAVCAEACKNDPNCKAFTFVKQGIQEEKAVCYLKNAITRPIDNVDCISGVKVDIPAQEMQIRQPMDRDNQLLQVSGDPYEMMGMPPADMIVPKASIFIKREEAIRSAESIPELNQQLAEITESSGIDVEQLYTRTMSGDKALNKIYKGKSYDHAKNFGKKGAPTHASQIDWTGGIQLTPMKCVSSQGFMYKNTYFAAAEMRISGIYASSDVNISDMSKTDFAVVHNGSIYTILRLPSADPELYLITMHVYKWKPILTDNIDVTNSTKSTKSIYTYSKLLLNATGDKYSGLIKLEGWSRLIFYIPYIQYVYGITITKL